MFLIGGFPVSVVGSREAGGTQYGRVPEQAGGVFGQWGLVGGGGPSCGLPERVVTGDLW